MTDERGHIAGHGPGNRYFAPVFEPDRQAARQIVIGHRRARSGKQWRLSGTDCALIELGRLERQPADETAVFPQEFDLGPAIRTEAVHVLDDRAASGTARRQRKIEHEATIITKSSGDHLPLVACQPSSHKRAMPQLFDPELREMRRDRAARKGVELFLYDRAFTDGLERIELMQRRFASALLIGVPNPDWPKQLRAVADYVEAIDASPLFASAAGGSRVREESWTPASKYDLIVGIGTLDTVDDLPRALRSIAQAMTSQGVFIGALSGGETLPRLRAAMRAADEVSGEALPHVHPRIEASAFAPLLASAGFVNPVVDVDRVPVAYRSFQQMVDDLRAMGATNILHARSRKPISRHERNAAIQNFAAAGSEGRTIETFELLHFAAWTAQSDPVKQR